MPPLPQRAQDLVALIEQHPLSERVERPQVEQASAASSFSAWQEGQNIAGDARLQCAAHAGSTARIGAQQACYPEAVRMARAPVYLGLGSNVGDREAAIGQALARLAGRGFRTTVRSSLYLTEPVDGPPQDWFVNAAAAGESALSPEALLEAQRCPDASRVLPLGPQAARG